MNALAVGQGLWLREAVQQRAVYKALIRVLLPILVVGHVLSALHFAVVQHTLCSEHGEWEHGAEADGHGHASADGEPVFGPHATNETSHSDHEGCALWFHSQRNPSLAPPSDQPVAEVSLPLIRVPSEATAAAHTAAILQFAPKQSPPVTLS